MSLDNLFDRRAIGGFYETDSFQSGLSVFCYVYIENTGGNSGVRVHKTGGYGSL